MNYQQIEQAAQDAVNSLNVSPENRAAALKLAGRAAATHAGEAWDSWQNQDIPFDSASQTPFEAAVYAIKTAGLGK